MIEFENDVRTRGEQLLLRAILRGSEHLAVSEWNWMRPDDFAHDLHGRIFRHVLRLGAEHIEPEPRAVFAAMCDERRGREPDGLADYLDWLVDDDPCFSIARAHALSSFLFTVHAQREAREEAARGKQ